jgi:hypothetical protein
MTDRSSSSRTVGIGFWLQWTGFTVLGFLLSLYWVEIGFKPDIDPWHAALGGATVGIAQFLALHPRVRHPWQWLLLSAIGWGVLAMTSVGAMGWVAPRTASFGVRISYGLPLGLQVGLVLGAVQWVALRSTGIRSLWWVPISGISWAIGLPYGWVVGGILRAQTGVFLAEVVGLAIGWSMVAAITASALVKILNQRAPIRLTHRQVNNA